MDRVQHSFGNFSLIQAATTGDEEGVRKAIEAGADVNALHPDGRTVIACAVTGEDWQTIDASFMSQSRLNVLNTLLTHRNISLFALNAPQDVMKGVTPLGMAAWLNWPEAVQSLLDSSPGAVSVDGMDAHGATALMYAARDGSLRVIQRLLSHGARPDFRDIHHRTSIQFALPHPRALWACEHALRRQRWQESQSGNKRNLCSTEHSLTSQILPSLFASLAHPEPFRPPPRSLFFANEILTLTNALVHAVLSSDLSTTCSLLFPPPPPPPSPDDARPALHSILVNAPDPSGWSAIHYCAAAPLPSIEVLDALYRAGADVSLFTGPEQYTPLHCLARSARLFEDQLDPALSLYLFTVHLVRDLRAPLSAKDKNQETCMHTAAEHGECLDVLTAFLACDTSGSVRNMRNSRGLTAFEVSKPEFQHAFGAEGEPDRPLSAASVRTVRPVTSLSSLSSFSAWRPAPTPPITCASTPDSSSSDFDVATSSQQLLENLRLTSPQLFHDSNTANLDHLHQLLLESRKIGNAVLAHFHYRTDEARKELRAARATFNKIDERLDIVAQAVRDKLNDRNLGLEFSHAARRNRDSEDSEVTAVSDDGGSSRCDSKSPSKAKRNVEHRDVGVATDLPLLNLLEPKIKASSVRLVPWPEWLDSFVVNADPSTYKTHITNLIEIEHELPDCQSAGLSGSIKKLRSEDARPREVDSVKRAWKSHHEWPKRREGKMSGTAKLKAWLWKKLAPERPLTIEIVREVDEESCAVGREVKGADVVFVNQQTARTEESCSTTTHSLGKQLNSPESIGEQELVSSHLVLGAAGRDLGTIEECMTVANQMISTIAHTLSRADRIIHKALEARTNTVNHLRLTAALGSVSNDSRDDLFISAPSSPGSPSSISSGYFDSPGRKSSPPSSAISLFSPYSSARSSSVSLASTLAEGDDEDTKALQRLLLRKILAQVDGAFAELNKTTAWLRIVKEVVRDVTKRACL